jgi:hypothetical protein
MKLHDELRKTAGIMRAELERSRLTVALAPCERGRANNMIRAVDSKNPEWYRAFCRQYPSSRRRKRKKPDTAIKRANTLRALSELEQGEMKTEYAERLFPFVCEEYLNHWQPERDPPSKSKAWRVTKKPAAICL